MAYESVSTCSRPIKPCGRTRSWVVATRFKCGSECWCLALFASDDLLFSVVLYVGSQVWVGFKICVGFLSFFGLSWPVWPCELWPVVQSATTAQTACRRPCLINSQSA